MAEYDRRSTRRDKQRRDSRQIASTSHLYGHQSEAVYTGYSYLPLDVQAKRDERIFARFRDDKFDDDELEDTQTVESAFQQSDEGEFLSDEQPYSSRFADNTKVAGSLPNESQTDISALDVTEKLFLAVEYAIAELPSEVAEDVRAVLTPSAIASMVGVFAAYAGLHATGIGFIADVAFLLAGVVFLGKQIISVVQDLIGFSQAINATTEQELQQAGKHLASAVSTVGISVVMSILTKKTLSKIQRNVRQSQQGTNPNQLPSRGNGEITTNGGGGIVPSGRGNNPRIPPVVSTPQLPGTAEPETSGGEIEPTTTESNEIVVVDETVLIDLEQQYPQNLFESNGNLVGINNQIDIHPNKIAETSPSTLTLIVESSRELDSVGGDITQVTPETKKTIGDLTKTAGGRWRFEYQKNAVVNQYLEYVGLEDNELFQNMSDAEKIRLFDIPNQMNYLDDLPVNAKQRKLDTKAQEKTIEQQAASYAIQQNPRNANEFVNHTEFYKTQIEQKIRFSEGLYEKKYKEAFQKYATSREIEVKNISSKQKTQIHRQISQEFFQELYGETVQFDGEKTARKYIRRKAYESSGNTDNIGQVNQKARDEIQNHYQEKVADIGDNIGGIKIEPNLSLDRTIEQIKSVADEIKFGDESAAAYHTEKHYGELPPSHQEGNNLFNDYWQSAIRTIKKSTEITSSYNQNGSRSFVFKHTYNEENEIYSLKTIVGVFIDGTAKILTYFKNDE